MGGGGRGKRNHRREGGEGKHISSFAEVMARNEGEQAKGKGKGKSKQDDGADESSEEEEASEVPRKGTAGLQIENPNHASRNEEKEGVELTRRQREEIEKAAARRRYEELHKAGQTDEAAEEAAQKRKAEEEAKKANDVKGSQKVGMSAELKEALGGEATRMPGARSQQKKENKDTPIVREGGVDLYTGYAGEGEKPAEKNVDNKDGSIQSCRAVEEDF
eukprot:CAMPEP_0178465052 /NCGR_PEP_ID=MMETSP0689_2-20121128/51158_1 /TAXON_ID=160604 /ORGANISM="Amphidinium massartii, Strain CS-259" /LENGTH=218 /DNA_ID=CAMNT_0020091971 /DNA_START=27 /DNA_END=681 /DNA_ORIENTATION=+